MTTKHLHGAPPPLPVELSCVLEKARAAFVDFDGVVADTEPLHARSYEILLREHGVLFDPSDFTRYVGNPAVVILSMMNNDFGISLHPETAADRRSEIFLDLLANTHLTPNGEVVAVVEYLHTRGRRSVILSSQRHKIITMLLTAYEALCPLKDLLLGRVPDAPKELLDFAV